MCQASVAQSVAYGLRIGGRWSIFFPRINDIHCYKIHSSVIAVHCFDDVYVGKKPVDRKEHCAQYWLKEIQESMDICTDYRDIAEIMLKHHTINQSINRTILFFRINEQGLLTFMKISHEGTNLTMPGSNRDSNQRGIVFPNHPQS